MWKCCDNWQLLCIREKVNDMCLLWLAGQAGGEGAVCCYQWPLNGQRGKAKSINHKAYIELKSTGDKRRLIITINTLLFDMSKNRTAIECINCTMDE